MNFKLFSYTFVNPNDWLNLLSHSDSSNHVYGVRAYSPFIYNGLQYDEDQYYLCCTREQAEMFKKIAHVVEFSFSDLVFLSDRSTQLLKNSIPDEKKLEKLAFEGRLAQYLSEDFGNTQGLKKMCEKVQKQYFSGFRGLIRKIFFIFFSKSHYKGMGMSWWGNSYYYANEVIKNINSVKSSLLDHAIDVSRREVAEQLGLSEDVVKALNFEAMKKVILWAQNSRLLLNQENKHYKPRKIQNILTLWQDYTSLLELRKKLDQKM